MLGIPEWIIYVIDFSLFLLKLIFFRSSKVKIDNFYMRLSLKFISAINGIYEVFNDSTDVILFFYKIRMRSS